MPWPSEGTTNEPALHENQCSLIMADSQLAICFRVWPSARSPQFFINASNSYYLTFQAWVDNLHVLHRFTLKALALPKPVWPDRQAYPWLGQGQASQPTKTSWGILDMTCHSCFQPQMARDKTTFRLCLLSYSRKPSLFGLVDYQSHQAWVLVSTISRLTYMRLAT